MKELTILIPCLNEAPTLETCILRAQKLLETGGLDGEVLISDNGSTDDSKQLALQAGARVVECPERGYGAALRFGIEHAAGTFILMGDGDDSYHFDEALPMIRKLQEGFDVCMGTRLKGTIMPGAMPLLNRYLGNPVLSLIGKVLFRVNVSDFHCGMRAFNRSRMLTLDLVTTGMEWASEMVIKSRLAGFAVTEVPITLHKDGRNRPPHLRPWRDGWRHLRFMFLHSPTWLFTFPGLVLTGAGLVGETILSQGMVSVGRARLDVHTLLAMAFVLILGVQITFTGIFATLYSHITGILPYDEKFNRTIRRFTLEKLLVVSLLLGSIGLWGFVSTFMQWSGAGFPELDYQVTMRRLVPSLSMVAVAVQGVFNGFMLSILFLKTGKSRNEISA
jgi:glycosyl transferase family 2